jgi:hypothetical protein
MPLRLSILSTENSVRMVNLDGKQLSYGSMKYYQIECESTAEPNELRCILF